MTDSNRIDQYARSMFAFDRPHAAWIDSCAAYLRSIFGDRLAGSTILDYAFGRGNWSLAALKAGARKVIAVDASETNVRQLSDYCRREGIGSIQVIHGNIVEQPLECTADILWIYGILQHIEETESFLKKTGSCRRNGESLAVIYGYDAGSLRHAIVSQARRGIVYESEDKFAEDSLLFAPAARLRVRDDLTAPFIKWFDQVGLVSLAATAGLTPVRKIADYVEWARGHVSEEFSPHLILFGFDGHSGKIGTARPRTRQYDIDIVAEFADAVMSSAGVDLRKKIAIGLSNTHFAALRPGGSAEHAILEDFLFLTHCLLRIGSGADRLLKGARYYDAALYAMRGQQRHFDEDLLATSPLARYLHQNSIRF